MKSLLASKKMVLTEEHIVVILYNILCGIKFLHSANIMHRDIKPANILIDAQCQIKICDFGMARSINCMEHDENEIFEKRDSIEKNF